MKLFFAILLLPLALANQRPADVKIIYSGGFVLAKGSNFPIIEASTRDLRPRASYGFYVKNNASRKNEGTMLEFNRHFLPKGHLNFVTESWLTSGPKKKEDVDWESCRKNSSDTLRHVIYRCYGDVSLREATNEELSEVQRVKDEFDRTKISAKAVYNNGTIRAQWNANVEKELFSIEVYDGNPRIPWLDRPGFYTTIEMNARKKFAEYSYTIMYNYEKDRKFVIEALPRDGPKVDCLDADPLQNMRVVTCDGPIKARPFTDDDQ